jgi:hypothetical protein
MYDCIFMDTCICMRLMLVRWSLVREVNLHKYTTVENIFKSIYEYLYVYV